jgi:hypothetical protein
MLRLTFSRYRGSNTNLLTSRCPSCQSDTIRFNRVLEVFPGRRINRSATDGIYPGDLPVFCGRSKSPEGGSTAKWSEI